VSLADQSRTSGLPPKAEFSRGGACHDHLPPLRADPLGDRLRALPAKLPSPL
jgi:hypothetical protein